LFHVSNVHKKEPLKKGSGIAFVLKTIHANEKNLANIFMEYRGLAFWVDTYFVAFLGFLETKPGNFSLSVNYYNLN
jgi:hypothetical protein